ASGSPCVFGPSKRLALRPLSTAPLEVVVSTGPNKALLVAATSELQSRTRSGVARAGATGLEPATSGVTGRSRRSAVVRRDVCKSVSVQGLTAPGRAHSAWLRGVAAKRTPKNSVGSPAMPNADGIDASDAVAVAHQIVQGTVSPVDGAERLGWMASEYEMLADALMTFKGLASAWEDDRDPDHR